MRVSFSQRLASGLAELRRVPQGAAAVQPASPFSSLEAQKLKFVAAAGRNKRRGAAAVEFAVVAPILFMCVLGIIEFSRILWVEQQINNAAREGARRGILPNSTQSEVRAAARDWLQRVAVRRTDAVDITVDPVVIPANQGGLVEVTVSVPYAQVSLVGGQAFWNYVGPGDLSARVQMVKEANDN